MSEFKALGKAAPELNQLLAKMSQSTPEENFDCTSVIIVVRHQLTPTKVSESVQTHRNGFPAPAVKMAWVEILTPEVAAALQAKWPSETGDPYVLTLSRDILPKADNKVVAFTQAEWTGFQNTFNQALNHCGCVNQLCNQWGLQCTSFVQTNDQFQTPVQLCESRRTYCFACIML
jgi:hypothetical protein